MKLFRSCLLLIPFMTTFVIAKAQTVDEIINKHIEAIGGKEKIHQINSIYIESTTQVMGNDAATTTIVLNGKGYKNESDFMGQKVVQCYTDSAGWQISPMGGAGAEPMPERQYKLGKDLFEVGGSLFDYTVKGSKAELVGQEKIGVVNAFKINLTNKDGIVTTYFIDPSTYYISQIIKKSIIMGEETDMTIKLSDFRKTDAGIVIPFSTDMDFGGRFTLTNTVSKVEFNKPVDSSTFYIPKS